MAIDLPAPDNRESLAERVSEAIGPRFGERFVMSAPYRVEVIDIVSTLTTGAVELGSATIGFARWQCIVGPSDPDESGPLAAVDVAQRVDGSFSVVSISHGRMAEAVNRAARIAAAEAAVTDYRFSTVELPELHFAAVRMSAVDEGEDLYIPLVDADIPSDADDVESIELATLGAGDLVEVLRRWWDGNGPDLGPDLGAPSGTGSDGGSDGVAISPPRARFREAVDDDDEGEGEVFTTR